ncbi:uncharacterized protein BYT42DRAFT_561018 [Radiomyces spectabilis]|uniref:uncharacterized protein n=1 Tax=Radiomyces spectabilis TaxID=64574 RepID=UPI0022210A57|nr:uncharacterized protein BYT42DRAFT_561018 [Radiomyces spectabilis]KAI8388727.1 hypothetical protein BYT42DRAFT_561018 [Radiomyces spectabilis]
MAEIKSSNYSNEPSSIKRIHNDRKHATSTLYWYPILRRQNATVGEEDIEISDKLHKPSATAPSNVDRCCRICYGSEENDTTQKFIMPCNCKGTVRFVHRQCHADWVHSNTSTESLECNMCRFKYHSMHIQQMENHWNRQKNDNISDYISHISVNRQNMRTLLVFAFSAIVIVIYDAVHCSEIRKISESRFGRESADMVPFDNLRLPVLERSCWQASISGRIYSILRFSVGITNFWYLGAMLILIVILCKKMENGRISATGTHS